MSNSSSQQCVKLGIATYMPYLYVGREDPPKISGSMPAVLDMIFDYLGLCYEYVLVPSRAGGRKLPNGTWTGVIKMIIDNEVAMPAVPMAVSYDRYQDLAATEFLYVDGWSASFKRPVLQSDITGFIRPFSFYVWIGIAATLLCVLLTTFFIHTSRESLLNDHRSEMLSQEERNKRLSRSWDDSVFWTIAVLLSQSLPSLPRGHSVRVVTGVWLLCSLILCTVYRSNLKAMLILPKVTLPFDSPEEMVDTGIPIWIPAGSALEIEGIKSSPGSPLARSIENANSLGQVTNVPWGINDMLAGKHIMTSPRASLVALMGTTFSETGQCLFYTMSEDLFKVRVSFLLRKDSNLTESLNSVIRRLREFGILDYEYHKQVLNATECQKPIGSQGNRTLRPLDLGDFYGVFMLYGGGMYLALLSFLTELVVRRLRNSRKTKENPPDGDAVEFPPLDDSSGRTTRSSDK